MVQEARWLGESLVNSVTLFKLAYAMLGLRQVLKQVLDSGAPQPGRHDRA